MKNAFICVITYNRPEGLHTLLKALATQKKHKDYDFTICVVDNDCTGQNDAIVQEIASRHSFFLVKEPQKGIVAARNCGVEEFLKNDYDVLLFIDDDEWPNNDLWVVNMVDALEETKADIIVSDVYTQPESQDKSWLIMAMGRINKKDNFSTIRKFYTGNVIMSRKVLETIKPAFDERFLLTGSSDYHFSLRCAQKNFIAKYTNKAPVIEIFPESRATLKWFFLRGYRSGNGVTRSHLYTESFLKVILKTLIFTLLRLGRSMITLILSIILFSKSKFYSAVRQMGSALGTFCGLFGLTYKEYNKTHGN